MWAFKWLKGAKSFRVDLMKTKNEEEVLNLVKAYFKGWV